MDTARSNGEVETASHYVKNCEERPRRKNREDKLEYDQRQRGKEKAELTTMMMSHDDET